MRAMISSITQVFRHWDVYPPYQALKQKSEKLGEILSSQAPRDFRNNPANPPIALVGNAEPIEEMVETYKVSNSFYLNLD